MALLLASIIVAFVGGLIALAMPCCFSVLLPSYFASAFRRRSRLVGMTLVFAAGIATVILPITLLAGYFGQLLTQQHRALFVGGGFLMVLIGMLSLWGRSIIPQIRLPIDLKRHDATGVYVVGVFSGIATSCCAPVLAGIAVLSALTPDLASTLLVAVSYVAGMVLPLFLVAIAWDRPNKRPSRWLEGKLLRFKLAGHPVAIHSSNLVAGIMFLLMGIVTIALGVTDVMISTPGSDLIGLYQVELEERLTDAFRSPWLLAFAWLAIGVGALVAIERLARRARQKPRLPAAPDEEA